MVHGNADNLARSVGDIANDLVRSGMSGNPIRLCACNAGVLSNGVAQELSYATGQIVIAPIGYLHTFSSGLHSIQSFSRPLRSWVPSTGRWRGFLPK